MAPACDGGSTTSQPTHDGRHLQLSHIQPANDNPSATPAGASLYPMLDAAVAVADSQASLTAMVMALLPLLRGLGLAILRHVIQQRDRSMDWRVRPPCCPECKEPLARTRNLRPTRRYTLLGLLTYERRNGLCTKCNRSECPTDWGLGVLDRLGGHSQEFGSMVVLMTTLMPNAKAMDLFQKCFGFAVSTTLSLRETTRARTDDGRGHADVPDGAGPSRAVLADADGRPREERTAAGRAAQEGALKAKGFHD